MEAAATSKDPILTKERRMRIEALGQVGATLAKAKAEIQAARMSKLRGRGERVHLIEIEKRIVEEMEAVCDAMRSAKF